MSHVIETIIMRYGKSPESNARACKHTVIVVTGKMRTFAAKSK